MEDLINVFIQVKKNQPLNSNELLDFSQQKYIGGEISIAEYRNLFRELNARGAKKPDSGQLLDEHEISM
nr:YppF family protein [Aneurinibacillus terranovensis]